ncbi:hypothetical protein TNCV_4741411 [Trichonephila clavipes]|nr:hypothetical protein TNCV_4741411 [Trichonephila clavipes]
MHWDIRRRCHKYEWTSFRNGEGAKVKNVGHPDILSTLCITHREQLSAQKIYPELQEVLSNVIEIIKEILDTKRSTHEYLRQFVKKWVPSILILFVMLRYGFITKKKKRKVLWSPKDQITIDLRQHNQKGIIRWSNGGINERETKVRLNHSQNCVCPDIKKGRRKNRKKRFPSSSRSDHHHIKRSLPGNHSFNMRRVPSSAPSGPSGRKMIRRESSPCPPKAAEERPGQSRLPIPCSSRGAIAAEERPVQSR